jgi:Zyg-11 family protein
VAELTEFVREQTQLRFLGLMLTDACKDEAFTHPKLSLVVTGSANEAQVLESLERYLGRQHYIKKSLSHLFGLTQGYSNPRIDIIKVRQHVLEFDMT